MSALAQPLGAVNTVVFLLLLTLAELLHGNMESLEPCPSPCTCTGTLLDCSRVMKGSKLQTIPSWITQVDLSHNKLRTLPEALFTRPHRLTEIKLNNNELEMIPDFGPYSGNISALILANNKISRISSDRLGSLSALETLDLSNNNLVDVKGFPSLKLKNLYMNNNRISTMEPDCFKNLSNTLLLLRLNRNRLNSFPAKTFQLDNLQHLDLSRNRLRRIKSLTFNGLDALRSLNMQRNGIVRLLDGAFWGLSKVEVLQMEYNNLTDVSKGWLYGLSSLQQLHLAHNSISRIKADPWEPCQKLAELDLSSNQLVRLEEGSFMRLTELKQLSIGHNQVSFIADGAFRDLTRLHTLDLKYNEISWTIEDMNGPFSALNSLQNLFLQGNQIRSVTKKSFTGLDLLERLDLSNNAIMSIQGNSFSLMKKLVALHMNTSSLLCDCQLKWFPQWVAENTFLSLGNASCAHPQPLKGKSVFAVSQDEFVCDDFPKPQITVQPETQSAIKGTNVTFVCSAASSSDSPMTLAWKKDNEVLNNAEIHNQAHLRAQEGDGSQVTEYTTTLQLRHVESSSEGKYQCVISNHFGSTYSIKAKLTVHMLPSFSKIPMDLTVRVGATARLECAATGHPTPQIAWQKDGGTDFPAARERRMHVMPSDAVFFIMDVKTEDIGVYSCTAQNTAGAISANATLTVLEMPSFLRPLTDHTVARGETAVLQCIAGGSPPPRLNWTKDDGPLALTERHFFAAGNQLLIIVDAAEADAGTYTCEMSNPLGTERGNVRLAVLPNPNCEPNQAGIGALGAVVSGSEEDGWTTVGIVIIAVVCCVVGTSLVWVVIIYHTRRRNEDCSVTNTDETNLPSDIPSYLSSQGTLAERQEGYVPSESGSNYQYVSSGFYLQPKDMKGVCQLDTGSETDMEAAIDPLLCHFQGPIGTLLRRGNLYTPDPTDTYTGCSADQRLVCRDSHSPSHNNLKKREFYTYTPSLTSEPFEHVSPGMLVQCEGGECVQAQIPSASYLGTFGKAPWRPQPELFPNTSVSQKGATLHESIYTALDYDSEHDEDLSSPSRSQNLKVNPDNNVFELPFDSNRIGEKFLGSQPCS